MAAIEVGRVCVKTAGRELIILFITYFYLLIFFIY